MFWGVKKIGLQQCSARHFRSFSSRVGGGGPPRGPPLLLKECLLVKGQLPSSQTELIITPGTHILF